MSAFFYLRRLLRSVSGRGPTASRAAAIDFGAWDLKALANAWRTARPYSHVVIDDLVPDRGLAALCEAVVAEPHQRTRGEIFDMLGSAETVAHPTLRAFHVSLGSEKALSAVHAITGKRPRRVVMRSFIYVDGSYLLPHTDHRDELGRLVAFAYYLQADGEGGELELFDCSVSGHGMLDVPSAIRIPARSNRLVLFDVTPHSLHQVREVVGGRRLSFSGWFYA